MSTKVDVFSESFGLNFEDEGGIVLRYVYSTRQYKILQMYFAVFSFSRQAHIHLNGMSNG